MKLLVTGQNGFVAGSVIAQARKTWQVHGVDYMNPNEFPSDVVCHTLDLRDKEKLVALVEAIQPDAIIHTAAIANIDTCEENQNLARTINVGATETLAGICRAKGVKMVLCSTDSVFDGVKGFYSETDEPHALNYYAETKIEAEKIVLNASTRNVVARLSLVMGLPVFGQGNSFLADTIQKLKAGTPVNFPANEIRTPVDVITLGSALTELAGNKFGGIIHLSGNTRINRYDMAVQIATGLGYNPELIMATNSNSIPGRAPRPDDASLDNSLACRILQTPMLTLVEGLALTLNYNK